MRVGGRQLGHIRGFEFHYFARHYFALGLPAPIAQLDQAGTGARGTTNQAVDRTADPLPHQIHERGCIPGRTGPLSVT